MYNDYSVYILPYPMAHRLVYLAFVRHCSNREDTSELLVRPIECILTLAERLILCSSATTTASVRRSCPSGCIGSTMTTRSVLESLSTSISPSPSLVLTTRLLSMARNSQFVDLSIARRLCVAGDCSRPGRCYTRSNRIRCVGHPSHDGTLSLPIAANATA